MLPVFQLGDLRRILLLFHQHNICDKFRELQKMVGRTCPEVVCVDVMPGIDRQVIYGKVESDETVQLVRDFCSALTNTDKKEQHFHEAPKKHLDQDVFFYSQVHTREAGSLLELLKLEHVAEMSMEELMVDIHGQLLVSDDIERLDHSVSFRREEQPGPYVDAANQRLDFSPEAGRSASAGKVGGGGQAQEASEALEAEEKALADGDGEAVKDELIRIIRGEWDDDGRRVPQGRGATMEDVYLKVHKEEIRAREMWRETLQQQLMDWNQKGSWAWLQTRRLDMLRQHRTSKPILRALFHSGLQTVRHNTWVRIKSVQDHCSRIVQLVEELEDRHRQVRFLPTYILMFQCHDCINHGMGP
jgi:hypothetical protein